jgi:heme-degrading monooxygenase HmoA
MSVTEIVRLAAVSGRGDDYARRLELALQAVADDPGCLGVTTFRGIEDRDSFVCTIEWTSVEAHYAWRDSPGLEQYKSFMAGLERDAPQFGHYEIAR